jgi:hypothetical protein
MSDDSLKFIQQFILSYQQGTFIKLVLSQPAQQSLDLVKVSFQPVQVKSQNQIKLVYTHKTKDITKIFDLAQVEIELNNLLEIPFKTGVLLCTDFDWHLMHNKKLESKLLKKNPTQKQPSIQAHDHEKKRFVAPTDHYLQRLGVCNENGQVQKSMVDKFKQIHKYVETFEGILKHSKLDKASKLTIVDMGSGKGYLTFALYHYLKFSRRINITMIGVEQRPDLVNLCNQIAKEESFDALSFTEGSIANFKIDKIDVLIALHACDTATDDAIYQGVSSKADIIITAPCCHKQVRQNLKVDNQIKHITQFGILEERQAEILTDAIRALSLEAQGYKSQVFEFIADAHTHKNVMVVGTKRTKQIDPKPFYDKIDELKQTFGLTYQHLDQKLRKTE